MSADPLLGLLLGTAVGDAVGLPREGLSRARAHRLFGDHVEHALVLGRGMLSDDTDHTCMVVQAFLAARGDRERFRRSLARRLRWWLAGLPPGVGLGTARAIGKLWMGFPPDRSGVRSAGNGPAMRCGALGLLVDGDDAELRRWVRAATRVTHTDERAERAAFLVALAARVAAATPRCDAAAFVARALAAMPDADDELLALLARLVESSAPAEPSPERGVSGYAYHTVPVALAAWLRHGADVESAVSEVVRLGGDSDTTGAITGAICGAAAGGDGVPERWLAGICDAPRSVAWLRRLAARATEGGAPLPLAWPLVPVRNLVQLVIVLAHGLRRLAPPY